jgi:hypothetical protein
MDEVSVDAPTFHLVAPTQCPLRLVHHLALSPVVRPRIVMVDRREAVAFPWVQPGNPFRDRDRPWSYEIQTRSVCPDDPSQDC